MPEGDHRLDWVTTYPLRIMFKMDGANQDGHPSTKGDVIVGNDVWIASGVKILSGVKIGDGAVGANALVSKDVEPYSIVVGNPAKRLRYRFDAKDRKMLLQSQWWNFTRKILQDMVDKKVWFSIETLKKYFLENHLV